jgi:Leucine-rich repeat (LRR) protein
MIAPQSETAMIVEPLRFSIWLPRPLSIGLAAAALLVSVLALKFGLPIYHQQVAIRYIKAAGGYYEMRSGRPQWLRQRLGARFARLFDYVDEVNLQGTGGTDRAMEQLSWLPRLKKLVLSHTTASDVGLAAVSSLKELEELQIGCTRVSDRGLIHLRHLKNLRELGLEHTQVTDAGLVHLKGLENLQLLLLYDTQITDAGLAHLKDIPSLKSVSIGNTRVTDAGVAELRSADPELWVSR